MNTPSNCTTCQYKRLNAGREGWCYMFRNAPDGECAQYLPPAMPKQWYRTTLGSLRDCGEAGHAEGKCGNASCVRGA